MYYLKKIFFILFLINASLLHSQIIHHNINVVLDVSENFINVTDTIIFESTEIPEGFQLNKNLIIKNEDVFEKIETKSNITYYTFKPNSDQTDKLIISYSGNINENDHSGAINTNGVYLNGGTSWIPMFEDLLLDFRLTVQLSKEWDLVSQGICFSDTIIENKHYVSYQCKQPMDEVYLIAGWFEKYEKTYNDIKLQAYLKTPDEDLANKYIDATEKYLKIYESLIGDYPYSKFALIENVFETGLGMPSFTLLGSKIIRYPWIIQTSYPHELLHNWWGNSVYVDYSTGNWCEGITSYMADHMSYEKQGIDNSYRKTFLIDYVNYVNDSNDYPLSSFVTKSNKTDEAIGYGKSLMLNEMLRSKLGNKMFVDGYKLFYESNKFKKASFADIRKAFETVSGSNLETFFDQWVNRKGAPDLNITNLSYKKNEEKYLLTIKLEQSQIESIFELDIPLAIYFDNDKNVQVEKLFMDKKEQVFTIELHKEPVMIEVDPNFSLFRRLDEKERPLTLSKIYGEKEFLIIVPSESPLVNYYAKVAKQLKAYKTSQGKECSVVYDDKIKKLPNDKTIWIYGFENKFLKDFLLADHYHTSIDASEIAVINQLTKTGSLVYTIPNPKNDSKAIGVFATNSQFAIPGLIRKMPHYGSKTFLGFAGDEPKNILKGTIPSHYSPLRYIIDKKARIIGKLAKREALVSRAKQSR